MGCLAGLVGELGAGAYRHTEVPGVRSAHHTIRSLIRTTPGNAPSGPHHLCATMRLHGLTHLQIPVYPSGLTHLQGPHHVS